MGRAWGMLSSGIAAAAALIGRGVIGGSLNFDGTRRYGPRVTATKNIGRGYKHSGERERLRHLRQIDNAEANAWYRAMGFSKVQARRQTREDRDIFGDVSRRA